MREIRHGSGGIKSNATIATIKGKGAHNDALEENSIAQQMESDLKKKKRDEERAPKKKKNHYPGKQEGFFENNKGISLLRGARRPLQKWVGVTRGTKCHLHH